MLSTFPVDFDFHGKNGGRNAFDSLASNLASRLPTDPVFVRDPIFTYARGTISDIDELGRFNDRNPAIVFLSNVVMHSSVLVFGSCDLSDQRHVFSYASFDEFRQSPKVRGYGVDRRYPLAATFDDTTIVISSFTAFLDDNYNLPRSELFHIRLRVGSVYACNVLNYSQYFARCAEEGDEPYFLPDDSQLDTTECAKHYDYGTLTELLLDSNAKFATLGDDHMDDEYAVSYHWHPWNHPIDNVAFVR